MNAVIFRRGRGLASAFLLICAGGCVGNVEGGDGRGVGGASDPGTGGLGSAGAPGTGGSGPGGTSGMGGRGGAGIGGASGATGSGGAGAGGSIGPAGSGGAPGVGGGTGVGSTDGGSTSSDLLVPTQGALFGGFIGTGTIAAAETQIGRKYAFASQYFDWPLDYGAFARDNIAAGRVPYVTVEPWTVTLDAIASGVEDATIKARAATVKALKGKIFLRFAHEMNGNWYPWDGFHNGADATAPPKYIAAFRHVKDVFVTAGVTNVLWVFCPNTNSVPGDAWNQWSAYYPGDTYVDWMCYDGYNFSGTTSFAAITSGIYSQFVAKNNKPIMLGETSMSAIEKGAWIDAILPAMKSQFPMLKAFVWFHVNEFRFDSSPTSLAAYIAMAHDPYFNP